MRLKDTLTETDMKENKISNLNIKKYVINYQKLVDSSYEKTMTEEGLVFTDKNVIKNHSDAIKYLIKKIGGSILKGESIMNTSLPVKIFDPRSLLEVYNPFNIDLLMNSL